MSAPRRSKAPEAVSPSSVRSDASDVIWQWLTKELKGADVPPLLLSVGLGGGGLLHVLDARAPGTRVLALEPDASVWHRTVANPTVAAWRQNGRLLYLCGPSYTGADEAWRMFPSAADSYRVIVDPRLSKGSPANLEAARLLKRIVFGVRANAEARRRFAPTYLTNVLRNLPAMGRGRDVRALNDVFSGVPAVIAAAGPSLDTAIDQLTTIGKRGVLIAADTALRPLLAAGIAPQFAVGVDPGHWNARHFHALPDCSRTWLVAESALDPGATEAFGDRTLWFRVGDHQPWPWLKELDLNVGHLSVWGSVLTAAFQVACLAGCDPIVIVGADLAYTGGRPYCRGTTYEFDWATLVTRGADLNATWHSQIDRAKKRIVDDLHGRETISTESMLSFRDWMVARAQKSGRRVINATGAGILFGSGIEQLTLGAALEAETSPAAVDALIGSFPRLSMSRVAPVLRDVHSDFRAGRTAAAPIKNWKDFCGESFDGDAVRAALEKAGTDLASSSTPETPSGKSSWSAEIANGALRCLPEGVARLTAALNGFSLPETVAAHLDASERPAVLHAALTLLQEICAADRSTAAEDVMPLIDVANAGSVAVSNAYEWPTELRWRILAFEALLGRAWSTRPLNGVAPLFNEAVRLVSVTNAADGSVARPIAAGALVRLAEQWWRCAATQNPAQASTLHRRFLRIMVQLKPTDTDADTRARLCTGADMNVAEPQMLARPRILTNEGLERSIVGRRSASGVVCVTPYERQSFVLNGSGQRETHHVWPRPIVGEEPWGVDGAIAWGNGLSKWPNPAVAAPYVMYRRTAADEVTIEELPVRPSIGTWWNDRMYWNCFPTPVGSWTGIASWAPGEGVCLELPSILLYALEPGVDELTLHPCNWVPGKWFERRLQPFDWKWRPGQQPTPAATGEYGSPVCSDTFNAWTATAFPDHDCIRFDSSDGRTVTMVCHRPLRLAWEDRALLVSTIDREVLLFEDLQSTLDEVARPA